MIMTEVVVVVVCVCVCVCVITKQIRKKKKKKKKKKKYCFLLLACLPERISRVRNDAVEVGTLSGNITFEAVVVVGSV